MLLVKRSYKQNNVPNSTRRPASADKDSMQPLRKGSSLGDIFWFLENYTHFAIG